MNTIKCLALASLLLFVFSSSVKSQHIIPVPKPGTIKNESKVPALNITRLTLSNGMKVILMPNMFEPGSIYFSLISPGGTSSYANADYLSAEQAAVVVRAGGLGNFDQKELSAYLKGKKAGVNSFIVGRTEGLNGRTTPSDLETAMELTNAYFTAPRKDAQAFDAMIAHWRAELPDQVKTANDIFKDTIRMVRANYNTRFLMPISHDRLDQISLDKSFKIYQERFADASNFSAIFIGDINAQQIKPLLEKYLAGLPSTYSNEKTTELGINIPKGRKEKNVYKGNATEAQVQLLYSGEFSADEKNKFLLTAVVNDLRRRLPGKVKSVDKGVYGPGISSNVVTGNDDHYEISIEFACVPERIDLIISAINTEIKNFQQAGPDLAALEKLKVENIKANEDALKTNGFWINYLKAQAVRNAPLDEVLSYADRVNSVHPSDIKQAAAKFMSGKNFIRFELLPENSK